MKANTTVLRLVCYDIGDDRRLRRVAKVMAGFGDRVQKSVFECHLDAENCARMIEQVQAVMNLDEDGLRVYTLCHSCGQERQAFGVGAVSEVPDVFIV